jgi:O-antigen/teichoic acid export membrane protein
MNRMSARAGGSTFQRNAAIMLGGTLLSQLLILGVMPVFTRIYPPSAIGVAALFMSWATTLSVIGTMRLDLGAVLPKSSNEASVLVRLILVQALALALAITLVVFTWGGRIGRSITDAGSTWLWFLGPMCVCVAMSQASIAVATRERAFGKIALLNIFSGGGFALWGLALWAWDMTSDGLVVARFLAQVGLIAVAIYLGLMRPLRGGPRLTWPVARRTYRRHNQFLLFNTPYSFFSAVASDLPVLIFAFVSSAATAAQYALAKTILIGPTRLVASALSQVFYKEAVDYLRHPRLEFLARRMLWAGLMFGFPGFALISVWGDLLFTVAFGDNWDGAGRMAMILSPAMWLCLQTGWMQRIFEATGRQKLSFQIQVLFDLAVIGSLTLLLTISHSITVAVVAYSVIFGANNIAYLVAGFRAASFHARPFITDMMVGSTLFAGFVLVGGAVRVSELPTIAAVGVTALLAVIAGGVAALSYRRKFRAPLSSDA